MSLPSFFELFRRLQDLDETIEIEAKTGREVGSATLRTVSAFSNEPGCGGGYILFGVAPDQPGLFGPTYKVVGVADTDKLQRDFATQCATALNVPVRPEIAVEIDPTSRNRVVVVFVPEAQPSEKPVYVKAQGLPRGAYRRISSADVSCTDDDLHALFQLRGTRGYDETVVEGATWEDFDPRAFEAYRRYRAELNPSAVELTYDDLQLARALYAVDRRDDDWVPTVAGLILFGSQAGLRRHCPMHRIDYLRIEGKEWVRDPSRRYQGLETREALMFAISRMITQILDDIPRAFHLVEGKIRRKEIPLLPATAIREAVVNAVMHRNYRTRQPVQILRYSNRLEIRNPGVSLVPDDRLGEPGSVLRNEKIAAVLHETQFAETKGSGIKVIRDTMKAAGLLPPLFESDRERDMFVATFLFHHFLGPDDLAWLAQFKDLHLSDEDAKALIFVREVGAISNAAYRALNDVETLVASGRLRALRDANVLEQKGKGAATYYVPGPRLTPPATVPSRQPAEPAPHTTTLSAELPALSADLEALSAELPPELRKRIGDLGQRTDPATLDDAVLALCAWRPLGLRELAHLTGRKADHLRQRSLRRLISSGRLEYTHPEEINHPDQAYRVSSVGAGSR